MPVIHLNEVPEIAVTGDDGNRLVMRKVIGSRRRDPRFSMSQSTESMSVTHIRHWSRHPRMTSSESDRAMFVVEGELAVQIGDEPAEVLKAGDFAFIPRGAPYEFMGDCTYLVINAPAFREGSDVLADAGPDPAREE